MRALILALAALAIVAACTSLDLENDLYACEADTDCLPGYVCGAQKFCLAEGGSDDPDAGTGNTDAGNGGTDAGSEDQRVAITGIVVKLEDAAGLAGAEICAFEPAKGQCKTTDSFGAFSLTVSGHSPSEIWFEISASGRMKTLVPLNRLMGPATFTVPVPQSSWLEERAYALGTSYSETSFGHVIFQVTSTETVSWPGSGMNGFSASITPLPSGGFFKIGYEGSSGANQGATDTGPSGRGYAFNFETEGNQHLKFAKTGDEFAFCDARLGWPGQASEAVVPVKKGAVTIVVMKCPTGAP